MEQGIRPFGERQQRSAARRGLQIEHHAPSCGWRPETRPPCWARRTARSAASCRRRAARSSRRQRRGRTAIAPRRGPSGSRPSPAPLAPQTAALSPPTRGSSVVVIVSVVGHRAAAPGAGRRLLPAPPGWAQGLWPRKRPRGEAPSSGERAQIQCARSVMPLHLLLHTSPRHSAPGVASRRPLCPAWPAGAERPRRLARIARIPTGHEG